jgi:hypothetical protein
MRSKIRLEKAFATTLEWGIVSLEPVGVAQILRYLGLLGLAGVGGGGWLSLPGSVTAES